jgi:hypothetical protein
MKRMNMLETINIKLNLTDKDLDEYQIYAMRRLRLRNGSYSGFIFPFAAIMLLFISGNYSRINGIKAISFIFGFIYLIYFMVQVFIERRNITKNLKKAFVCVESNEVVEISFYDEVVNYKSSLQETALQCKWIKEIVKTMEHIFIIGNRGTAYIIPLRDLDNDVIRKVDEYFVQKGFCI